MGSVPTSGSGMLGPGSPRAGPTSGAEHTQQASRGEFGLAHCSEVPTGRRGLKGTPVQREGGKGTARALQSPLPMLQAGWEQLLLPCCMVQARLSPPLLPRDAPFCAQTKGCLSGGTQATPKLVCAISSWASARTKRLGKASGFFSEAQAPSAQGERGSARPGAASTGRAVGTHPVPHCTPARARQETALPRSSSRPHSALPTPTRGSGKAHGFRQNLPKPPAALPT